MQQVKDIIPQVINQPAEQRSTTYKDSESNSETRSQRQVKRTERLFAKLTANYGNAWASQIKDETMGRLMFAEWMKELWALSDEQIIHGLSKLDGDFPPSLPKFKSMCLDDGLHWQQKAMIAQSKQREEELAKALPDKRTKAEKKEHGLKHVANIKDLLKGASK